MLERTTHGWVRKELDDGIRALSRVVDLLISDTTGLFALGARFAHPRPNAGRRDLFQHRVVNRPAWPGEQRVWRRPARCDPIVIGRRVNGPVVIRAQQRVRHAPVEASDYGSCLSGCPD